jgi:glycogen debranching enzyme
MGELSMHGNHHIDIFALCRWVCNWDPQNCFVKSDKLIYLSRCLNVWSDCVKLRYGDSARDSPFLWQYMSEYCERLASLFFGVRLDNVHSTPSHVAKVIQ